MTRETVDIRPLSPAVGAVHRFDGAKEALVALASGRTTGKQIVRIDRA